MQAMTTRWLQARRDALVDRALAYVLPVAAVLALAGLESLPLPLVTGAAGLAVGASLGAIKKPTSALTNKAFS